MINNEVMLRGFNAGNMPGPLDTKMIFLGEFLYVRHTGVLGLSPYISVLAVLLMISSIVIPVLAFIDFYGDVYFDTIDVGGIILSWIFFIVLIGLVRNLVMLCHISKISSVEDSCYCRIIQNKKGKYGLCAPGLIRKKKSIRILKRMTCDEIVRVSGCSYVVKKKDRYGIYNSSLKKFIVPLECEHISVASDGNGLVVIKDNGTMRYSFEGFRSFEKENI